VSHFRQHVFVCVNDRPTGGKPACGANGRAVASALREELAKRPACWADVAITESGCLGPCFDGPNAVIYPKGTWYARVNESDAREIFDEHIEGGRVIARLEYTWNDE
jgi:(2Fe-2S) ferredoxin